MAAIGAALLLGQPALAADLPVAPTLPPPAPVFNWTTVYFGVNGGYGFARANSEVVLNGVTLATGTETLNGFVGGVQAGANAQFGMIVVGLEGDLSYTAQKWSSSAVTLAGLAATQTDRIGTLFSMRGRIGVAAGEWLFYGTGGIARQFWRSELAVTGLAPGYDTDAEWAWIAGAGVEAALSKHYSVRLEYLYFNSSKPMTTTLPVAVGGNMNWHLQNNLIRLGFNFML